MAEPRPDNSRLRIGVKRVERRRTQLLGDLKDRRRYWELKEKVKDRSIWKRQFITWTEGRNTSSLNQFQGPTDNNNINNNNLLLLLFREQQSTECQGLPTASWPYAHDLSDRGVQSSAQFAGEVLRQLLAFCTEITTTN